ncbi:MAG: hypothetical protein IT429_20330 [Gemmataceae bacterium]|nr:hypothetical protein [Gemmataceae bacterium]
MTQLVETNVTETSSDTDLVAAVRRVLEASPEPLTVSKVRSALPSAFRAVSVEALAEVLGRQVAASVLVQYPKYRSAQDRFWDRPMRVHVTHLLQVALAEQPLAASELRRKLPDYAKTQAEAVLEEEVAQGRLFRHPPANARSGPRFGAMAPDPRTFLRTELNALFGRLARLGFGIPQLREAALEVLHDEEWAPTPEPEPAAIPEPTPTASARPDQPEPDRPAVEPMTQPSPSA